jgi:acetoin utilization protein AcuB
MIVRHVMIEDITTVSPDTTLQEAYDVIESKHYDCLPVRDDAKHVVGIIQLTDIYEACMKHGRQVALAKPVSEVMSRTLVTIHPDEVVERAAKIMLEHDVPMLPVVEEGQLVGILNEADIFKAFSEMLGAGSRTSRLTLVVPDRRGALARIAEIIRDAGISITNVATFYSPFFHQYKVVVRVETEEYQPLVELLDHHGYKVMHATID